MKSKTQFILRIFVALISIVHLYFMSACGSAVVTNPGNALPEAPQLGAVVNQAFNLGGDYPADIDIVNSPGIQNIAFITGTFPAGVFAVDLNTNPLALSSSVKGLSSLPTGAGIPKSLFVQDASHAFLLTSSSLFYFNPSNSQIYDSVDLTGALLLSSPLLQQDKNGNLTGSASGTFVPQIPGDVIVSNNKVLVSFSNTEYGADFQVSTATQGIVEIFSIQGDQLNASIPAYVATRGFNPTGFTLLSNNQVLVTNSGYGILDNGVYTPTVNASVEILDTSLNQVVGLPLDLGKSYPSFRSWALSPDGSKAYIGSASGGFVLEIALSPLTLIRGLNNPIVISSASLGSDYITEVLMSREGGGLFVFSFNHSSVYAVDLTQTEPQLLPSIVDLTIGGGAAGVTGAGPAALRPGTPGVDFSGFDLFVLTSNPGTVAAIKTY